MNAVVKQEGQLVPIDSGATLLQVIARTASDPSADVEKMERLMAMYERLEVKRAEAAFNEAMTAAQQAMGRIAANAENKQTRSKYATYAALDQTLRPIYTDHGFALSFDTGKDAPPEFVRVVCHVSHKDGHTRSYHADIPADGKGAKGGDVMTKTHAVGAGMSYGMRYLLKMIFNVAIGEDDTDGNAPLDKKALDWIAAAQSYADLESYQSGKHECVRAYGMPEKVPEAVQQAFRATHERLEKK